MKPRTNIITLNWLSILAAIIFLITLYLMKIYEHDFMIYSKGAETLDMRFGYSTTSCYQLLVGLGEEGRAVYQKILVDDLIFITSFFILQDYLMKCAIGKSLRKSRMRYFLPLSYLRAFFDYFENIIIMALMIYLPKEFYIPARLLSIITQLKFVTLWLWLAALLFVLVIRLVKKGHAV